MIFFFIFYWGGWGGGSLRNRTMFFFFFFFFLGGGGVISIHFRVFKVKIQNRNIFWAAEFQIFLGMPDIPDFFLCVWGGGGAVNQ